MFKEVRGFEDFIVIIKLKLTVGDKVDSRMCEFLNINIYNIKTSQNMICANSERTEVRGQWTGYTLIVCTGGVGYKMHWSHNIHFAGK